MIKVNISEKISDLIYSPSVYMGGVYSMKPLKNIRHEKFAFNMFKGMSQTEAAIYVGYKPSPARFTGRDLATYSHILSRILELLSGGREAPPLMPIY